MPLTLDQLREEALSLPDDARRQLLDCLWDSFEDESLSESPNSEDFSPEYLAELDRRSAEVDDGTAVLIPYEDVKRHVQGLLRKAG